MYDRIFRQPSSTGRSAAQRGAPAANAPRPLLPVRRGRAKQRTLQGGACNSSVHSGPPRGQMPGLHTTFASRRPSEKGGGGRRPNHTRGWARRAESFPARSVPSAARRGEDVAAATLGPGVAAAAGDSPPLAEKVRPVIEATRRRPWRPGSLGGAGRGARGTSDGGPRRPTPGTPQRATAAPGLGRGRERPGPDERPVPLAHCGGAHRADLASLPSEPPIPPPPARPRPSPPVPPSPAPPTCPS